MDNALAVIMFFVFGFILANIANNTMNINLSLKKIINIERTINKLNTNKE